MAKLIELSQQHAQQLVLNCQGLASESFVYNGLSGTHQVIKQLGYVQIDSISVLQRAHHHVLYNRVGQYQPAHLTQLLADKQIFEYWAHAAAYLPMCDYRFSLLKKHAISAGEKHWRDKNPKAEQRVLKRIEQEGPLQAKDFAPAANKKSTGWWDWKPDKISLEQLFIEGKLMVSERKGFQKVYDLTERVLPAGVDTSMPSQDEFNRHLVTRYLKSNGIGSLEQIVYLRKGVKRSVAQSCLDMLENEELEQVSVAGNHYFVLPDWQPLLGQSINHKHLQILSPFDNLVIQRKRLAQLFNFDYQIECYVPQAKRQYGYFSLPLLWGTQFIGRMDAKIERNTQVLHIQNLHLETAKVDEVIGTLQSGLKDFMQFNGGHTIKVHKVCLGGALDLAKQAELKQRLENI